MVFYRIIPKIFFISIALFISLNNTSVAWYAEKPRTWGSLEYLYWWSQDSPISVPLVTQNKNPLAFARINEPGTRIIIGSGSGKDVFNLGGSSGGRITMGGWLDNSCQFGLEGSAFALSQQSDSFTASSLSGKIPVINIPFFSTEASKENVLVNRLPNTATVRDTFEPYSVELNALYDMPNQTRFPLVLLAGFRYVNIKEDLRLNDAIINIPTVPPNSIVNVRDNFKTRNHFYGFQVGARTHYSVCPFDINVSAKIALGINDQKLKINGETNVDNKKIIQPIGLFAEPSNTGSFLHRQFTIMPALEAKISYYLNRYVRPFMTYNFIYINNVIRSGDQIDRNINLSQNSLIGGTGVLTGPASPVRKFNNTSMWIQGLSIGMEFNLV